MERKYITVFTLNRYIKKKLNQDLSLQNVYIKGEISNYRPHPSGHLYFTLKDEHSSVSAIMFASYANKMTFRIEDGMQVLIRASVSVYEVSGQYQLYVQDIEQDGIGKLYMQFEQLKISLEKEGLFDIKHKKNISPFPKRIAILSARGSDALQDILNTIEHRFPFTRVIIFPIPVQGKGAYLHIIDTLKNIDSLGFDTIIIARGGGSIEQLWNFNEEALARCIYDLKTPIISGIGHETDFTICDFVSDLRAITPTDAAVKATPDQYELKRYNEMLLQKLESHMKHRLDFQNQKLSKLKNSYYLVNPEYLYAHHILTLSKVQDQLVHQFQMFHIKHKQNIHQHVTHLYQVQENYLNKHEHDLQKQLVLLDSLSPLKVMQRGYTLIRHEDHMIKSIKDIHSHDEIDIMFYDGQIKAKVGDLNE